MFFMIVGIIYIAVLINFTMRFIEEVYFYEEEEDR